MSRCYRVQVAERLDPAWSAWLHELIIHHNCDGSTLLVGVVTDHAALVEVLINIVAIGATLTALEPVSTRLWSVQVEVA